MPKVRLSTKASDYLKQEARYLRDRNPAAAVAFVVRIRQAQQLLSDFPEVGPGKRGLPLSDMRCLVVGDYLMDYQVRDGDVRVLAIRHGRQPEITIEFDDVDYDVVDS